MDNQANGYDDSLITIGTIVRNIECGWCGQVIAFETIQGDRMIRCQYREYDGSLDEFDTRWFAPEDCVAVK